jgi:apolipoprotein N-acyltransferase
MARAAAGWSAGLGLFVPGLFWATSFSWYGGVLLMAVEALYLGVACLATPPGRGRSIALIGSMVLMEALRGAWPFGGMPLGGLALGQASGPLAGSARLGGPLLVVALVWVCGCGAGALAVTGLGTVERWRGAGAFPSAPRECAGVGDLLGCTAAVLAVVAVLATASAVSDGGPGTSTVRAAAVQGGGVRGLRQSQVDPTTVFAAQVDATATIPAVDGGRPPTLVLWPENAISLPRPLDAAATQELGAYASHLHATFVVGVTETVSPTRFRNEVLAFSPAGRLVARYEKAHRVPFGEYVPGRAFFSHLADLSAVPRDAIAGRGTGLLRTPAGELGTMISYEVFFPERGRAATRAGATVLIVPTNTSSYSTSQVPSQELAASQLQAIAEGRDLVQASPTGFIAVIDNHGRVLARSGLSERAVLVRDVRLRTGSTIYERFGDLPVLLLAGTLVAAGWAAALASQRPAVLGRQRRRVRSPVVAGMDVDAGNALAVEHLPVARVVLEGEAQVEAVGAKLLDR